MRLRQKWCGAQRAQQRAGHFREQLSTKTSAEVINVNFTEALGGRLRRHCICMITACLQVTKNKQIIRCMPTCHSTEEGGGGLRGSMTTHHLKGHKREENAYHDHPALPHPNPKMVHQLFTKQLEGIAGTKEQMGNAKLKEESANYEVSDGLGFVFQFRGTVLEMVWQPVLLAFFFALVVAGVHENLTKWEISDQGHKLTMFPLGFLLAFRANISYGRWWDGRAMIGEMVVAVRGIAVKTITLIAEESDQDAQNELVDRVVRHLMAIVIAIRHSVQRKTSGEQGMAREKRQIVSNLRYWELEHYLTDTEIAQLRAVPVAVQPTVLINRLCSMVVKPAQPGYPVKYKWPEAVGEITKATSQLLEAWQGMLKVAGVPMPLPYAHCLELFTYLWVFTLPFPLVGGKFNLGYIVAPAASIACLLLLGANTVGRMIENPFGNDVTDFDLIKTQRSLHQEMVALLGRTDRVWAPIQMDEVEPDELESSLHPLLRRNTSDRLNRRKSSYRQGTNSRQPSTMKMRI
eukprot:Hpha_TRINITY_DN16133_c2_g8::TRINITY_DN16133_c2_g8_i3::g.5405::m.5405/K08994/yneE; putative membrane protein